MGNGPFKLKGFSGFGNSPQVLPFESKFPANPTSVQANPYATNIKSFSPSTTTTTLQDFATDVSTLQSNLTKKHPLYKDKRFSLSGQVNMPQVNLGWNPKGSMTQFGSPTLNFSNSANLSGRLKIGKNTTLRGGVNFASGKSPQYSAGLRVNF